VFNAAPFGAGTCPTKSDTIADEFGSNGALLGSNAFHAPVAVNGTTEPLVCACADDVNAAKEARTQRTPRTQARVKERKRVMVTMSSPPPHLDTLDAQSRRMSYTQHPPKLDVRLTRRAGHQLRQASAAPQIIEPRRSIKRPSKAPPATRGERADRRHASHGRRPVIVPDRVRASYTGAP
jgi:hypothetical protein